jgi:hypothetical protein
MNIVLSGASSYYCADPVAASTWLVEQGYKPVGHRSQYEYLRLVKGRSLLVVYHNGTILMQGADTATPRQLFDSLNAQPALPF